jgi:phosphopantetheine--protein transferase-like protein
MEERERVDRFLFDPDRHVFLLAHALRRAALSRVLGVPPESLFFQGSPSEKPTLASHGLDFNLTHTRGFAAVAIAAAGSVGVDAEPFGRANDIAGIRERVFTAREIEMLDNCDPPQRTERLVWLWTVKEAVMKVTGAGFARDPLTIETRWIEGEVTLETDPFRIVRLRAGDYAVALATDTQVGGPALFRFRGGEIAEGSGLSCG